MKLFKIIGIALVGAAAVGIAALAIANPGKFAETSADSTDERLRPRRYKTTLETFTVETEKIVLAQTTYLQNWKIAASSLYENSASIKAEVPVLIFTDDLEIKAENDAEKGEIIVNVYSTLRVGNSDFGENRRHVLQILKALDERFY